MKSSTNYAILGMISLDSQSGYDIKKNIEKDLGHFWHEGYSKIYPALKRLVSKGLVTVRTETQFSRPNRRVYTVTVDGLVELKKWLEESVDKPGNVNELLLKLYFGNLSSSATMVRHLKALEKSISSELRLVRKLTCEIREIQTPSQEHINRLIVFQYGIKRCECILTWCRESLSQLRDTN